MLQEAGRGVSPRPSEPAVNARLDDVVESRRARFKLRGRNGCNNRSVTMASRTSSLEAQSIV
jgi:hypothetical protein